MRAACVALCCWVGTAFADGETPQGIEPSLREPSPPTGFSADVFASLAGDATGDQLREVVTVGARLSTPGMTDDCRYAQAGGALSLDGRTPAAEAWGTVCVFRAGRPEVAEPGLVLHYDAMFDVRPQLSARRELLAVQRTGASIGGEGSALEGASDLGTSFALLPYDAEIDLLGHTRWRLSAAPFEIWGDPVARLTESSTLPASRLRVLDAFMSADDSDTLVEGVHFVTIEGVRWGGLRYDGDVGVAFGRGGVHGVAIGSAGVERGPWKLRFGRDVYPAFGGAWVLEDRVTGTLDLRGLELDAFGARTQTSAATGTSSDWTGGVSLSWAIALGRRSSLLVGTELGRSWYASGDDSRPALGARAYAVLSVHGGR